MVKTSQSNPEQNHKCINQKNSCAIDLKGCCRGTTDRHTDLKTGKQYDFIRFISFPPKETIFLSHPERKTDKQ